ILVAFLIPTMWLSAKHADNPVPQVAYGSVLPKLAEREAQLARDPREQEVRASFQREADQVGARLASLPASWESGRRAAQQRLDTARLRNVSLADVRNAERALAAYPKTPEDAEALWRDQRRRLL